MKTGIRIAALCAIALASSTAWLSAQETPAPAGQGQPGAGDTMNQGMMGRGRMGPGMMGHGMMIGPGMMMGGGRMNPAMMRMMIVILDTDGDGTLSLEEIQAVHARMFKSMDADKDGKLTADEMQRFMQGE